MLDGATPEPGRDTGCRHSVRWYVTSLGGILFRMLATATAAPLRDLLRDAIDLTCAAHRTTCDLVNPCTPSAAVALLRQRGSEVDYLSLADCTVLLERRDDTVEPVVDDRIARFETLSWPEVRARRNTPDGFWVAGGKPEAACHAVTGTVPGAALRRAALLTDGATRLVDRFGSSWRELLDLASEHGPDAVIRAVREREARGVPSGGKRHDDATAVLVTAIDPGGVPG